MYSYIDSDKAAAPVLRSARLLDQLRERIRYLHYSLQTEKAYLYWARFFIRWHGRNGSIRHPKDRGKLEVAAGGVTSPPSPVDRSGLVIRDI